MSGIIVGVDGSDQSCHALGWALREAVQRHAPLTVMTVRPVPARPATELYWAPLVYSEGSLDQEQARHAVQRLVDKTARGIGEPLPEVTVGIRRRSWSRPRAMPTCSWSVPAAPAGSPSCCLAR
jgi:nucleotide-binding universal stress UspA family protein